MVLVNLTQCLFMTQDVQESDVYLFSNCITLQFSKVHDQDLAWVPILRCLLGLSEWASEYYFLMPSSCSVEAQCYSS